MASQVELEEMVVRLTADVQQYLHGLEAVRKKTEEVAKHTEEHAEKIEKIGEGLEGFAHKLEKAFAFVGITVGLREAYEKFEQAERMMIRLDAAIEVNGGDVKKTTADYMKFANQIRDTTAYSKADVLTSIQRAETLGLTGEAAKKATKDALALAAATGMDTQTAVQAITMYEQGNKHLLQRSLHLHGVTDAQELNEKIQQRLAMGYKIMEAEGETAGAKLERTWSKLGVVTKQIGGIVSKAIEPIVDKLQAAADWFEKLSSSQKDYVIYAGVTAGTIALLASQWSKVTLVYKKVIALQAVLQASTVRGTIIAAGEAIASLTGKLVILVTTSKLAQAGIVTALAAGLTYLGAEILGVNKELREMDERLKSLSVNADKWKEFQKAQTGKAIREAAAIDESEPGKGQEILEDRLKKIKEQVEDEKAALKSLKKSEREATGSLFKSALTTMGGWIVGDPHKEAEKAIQSVKDQIKSLEEQAEETKHKIEEMLHPKANPEDILRAKEELKRLKEEYKTLGMTDIEKRKFELTAKHIEPEQVDKITKQMELNEARKQIAEDTKKNAEEIQKTLQGQSDELIKINQTEEERKRWEFQLAGATKDQLDLYDKMADKIDKAKRAKEESNRLDGVAKKLREEMKTPLDSFMESQDDLNAALKAGKITQDQYVFGINKAEEAFNKAGDAAAKAKTQVQQLNGILSGSAEAKFAISSFLQGQQQDAYVSAQKRAAQGLGEGQSLENYKSTQTRGDMINATIMESGFAAVVSAILSTMSTDKSAVDPSTSISVSGGIDLSSIWYTMPGALTR